MGFLVLGIDVREVIAKLAIELITALILRVSPRLATSAGGKSNPLLREYRYSYI